MIAARPGRVHRDVLGVFERMVLKRALEVTGGRQLQAARLLGLNLNTVRSRCRELHVYVPRAPRVATADPPEDHS